MCNFFVSYKSYKWYFGIPPPSNTGKWSFIEIPKPKKKCNVILIGHSNLWRFAPLNVSFVFFFPKARPCPATAEVLWLRAWWCDLAEKSSWESKALSKSSPLLESYFYFQHAFFRFRTNAYFTFKEFKASCSHWTKHCNSNECPRFIILVTGDVIMM